MSGVRKNELAIVVDLTGPDDGKLVFVVDHGDSWADIGDTRKHWACDTLGQRMTLDCGGISDGVERVDYADDELRPLRDRPAADGVSHSIENSEGVAA